jgi:hypothetical protein
MNSTGVHSFNVTVRLSWPLSLHDPTEPDILITQGSGSGNMRRKTEVSIGITQSIQMDRIPSANGQDQESYDERKIATVA